MRPHPLGNDCDDPVRIKSGSEYLTAKIRKEAGRGRGES